MSSYFCEKCGAPIMDTRHGYITGCAHHPLTRMEALCALFQELYKRALCVKENPEEIDRLIDRLRELTTIYSVKRDATEGKVKSLREDVAFARKML